MTEQELIEALADKEHASWARWQAHLFKVCDRLPNGAILISPELVKHWQRLIDTSYADLSEHSKQSDRKEVAHILPIIRAFAQERAGSEPLHEDRQKRIVEIIAWNLNLDSFDDDDCETELVAWVLDTYKRLKGYAPSSLPALLYANSLAEEEESEEAPHAQS